MAAPQMCVCSRKDNDCQKQSIRTGMKLGQDEVESFDEVFTWTPSFRAGENDGSSGSPDITTLIPSSDTLLWTALKFSLWLY